MVTQPMSTPLILCTSHDGSVQGYILQFCLEIVTTLSLVHRMYMLATEHCKHCNRGKGEETSYFTWGASLLPR